MSKFKQQQNSDESRFKFKSILNLRFLMIAVVLSSLGGYLWQINTLSNTSYSIKELEKQVSNLQSTGKDLENKATKLRSLTEIQNKIDRLAFQTTEKVEYLNSTTNVIAQK